ncbi:MAG: TerB family tellurite resistance protein [Paludibacteraceae bacterium]|nr:TerB family tellurite resistance protein [Paludibacteraceae bacterium]
MGLFGKILAGGLGWTLGGPIGAIIGVTIASMFDTPDKVENQTFDTSTRPRSTNQQANDFQVALLVLIAAVMKADGRIVKSELSVVKRFLLQNYGEEGAREALQILKDLLDRDINVADVAMQCAVHLNYSVRLQLINMLIAVASGDGNVDASEINVIRNIARYMRVSDADLSSLSAMFAIQTNPNWAYEVLELSPTCTDDEIKKAYRRMAMKYHPDKVNSLGEDVKQSATEKFRKVKDAYDHLKKERGF